MQVTTQEDRKGHSKRNSKNLGIYAVSSTLSGGLCAEAVSHFGVDPKWALFGTILAASGATAASNHVGPWLSFSLGSVCAAGGILAGTDPDVASFLQSPSGILTEVAVVCVGSAMASSAEVNEGNHFAPPFVGSLIGCVSSALMAFMAVSGVPSEPVDQPIEQDVRLACDTIKARGSEVLIRVAGKNGESLALVMPADCIPK